jgi:hypothetical protein
MIPETKGRSLEEMDIVFGAVSADDRAANIARHEHGTCFRFSLVVSFVMLTRAGERQISRMQEPTSIWSVQTQLMTRVMGFDGLAFGKLMGEEKNSN